MVAAAALVRGFFFLRRFDFGGFGFIFAFECGFGRAAALTGGFLLGRVVAAMAVIVFAHGWFSLLLTSTAQ